MKWIRICIDLFVSSMFIPFTLIIALFHALRSRGNRREASDSTACSILHFSGGSSTNAVLNKFGSLEFLFNYDGPFVQKLFKHHLLFWGGSSNTLRLTFNNGWELYETRKLFGHLQLCGALHHLLRAMNCAAQHNIGIVRSWDPFLSGLTGMLAARLLGVPFVVSIHADFDQRVVLGADGAGMTIFGSRHLSRWVERFIYQQADGVLPMHASLAEKAKALGADPQHTHVFRQGINLAPFKNPASTDLHVLYNIPKDCAILSFVGRMEKENYVLDYPNIVRKLIDLTERNFILVMAGSGSQESKLQQMVAADPLLKKHIVLIGQIPLEEVIELRKGSEVGLGLMAGFSMLEAMAAGRPFICYNIEWHREVMIDGETGFLIEDGDLDSVAEATARLLNTPEEAQRLGRNARKRAFERYDRQAVSMLKRDIYQQIINHQK